MPALRQAISGQTTLQPEWSSGTRLLSASFQTPWCMPGTVARQCVTRSKTSSHPGDSTGRCRHLGPSLSAHHTSPSDLALGLLAAADFSDAVPVLARTNPPAEPEPGGPSPQLATTDRFPTKRAALQDPAGVTPVGIPRPSQPDPRARPGHAWSSRSGPSNRCLSPSPAWLSPALRRAPRCSRGS